MIIKCSECNHEVKGVECPGCHETTPEEGTFCINCGKNLKASDQSESGVEDDGDFDLDNRVLCSDGSCTGIIIAGKCSECGKPPEA